MGTGTKSSEWEGVGTRKSFPHISGYTFDHVGVVTPCQAEPLQKRMADLAGI